MSIYPARPELVLSESKLNDISTIFLLDQENNARPYSFNVLKEMFLGDALILKAEVGGKCVGYVISEIVYEDAEIISIVVEKSFRRCGYGEKLLKAAMEECRKRGATRFLLEVEETNKPAISLYQKAGFKQISLRNNYYGNNSALIMELKT